MRTLWLIALTTLTLLLSGPASAAPIAIPEFTPNVVDPNGYLDAEASARVNAELQRIRETSNVWGAVYLVDTLGGEPIENLAVEAFEKWKLGQAGVDNGLLLVLAIDDRKSRFEVGYGLEGTITDVAALRALDGYLAPRMREGDTAGAIIDAFGFLDRLVAQDPTAQLDLQTAAETSTADSDMDWKRGQIAWAAFLAVLWLAVPLRNAWVGYRRKSLFDEHPVLALRKDDQVATPTSVAPHDGRWKFHWGILLFLSVNPGLFVFFLSALEETVFYASLALPVLILALVIYGAGRRFGSPERYQKFLDDIIKERANLISMGHLEETSPGVYHYTPAYHAARAAAASSPSSSSSSSSSSSGGGRSGGGGASSSW